MRRASSSPQHLVDLGLEEIRRCDRTQYYADQRSNGERQDHVPSLYRGENQSGGEITPIVRIDQPRHEERNAHTRGRADVREQHGLTDHHRVDPPFGYSDHAQYTERTTELLNLQQYDGREKRGA